MTLHHPITGREYKAEVVEAAFFEHGKEVADKLIHESEEDADTGFSVAVAGRLVTAELLNELVPLPDPSISWKMVSLADVNGVTDVLNLYAFIDCPEDEEAVKLLLAAFRRGVAASASVSA